MDIGEYQRIAHSALGVGDCKVNCLYPAMELAEEAKTVERTVISYMKTHNETIDEDGKKQIEEELGDVCWCIAEMCTDLGISMEKVLEKNLQAFVTRT